MTLQKSEFLQLFSSEYKILVGFLDASMPKNKLLFKKVSYFAYFFKIYIEALLK
jgi:hypothetical protein